MIINKHTLISCYDINQYYLIPRSVDPGKKCTHTYYIHTHTHTALHGSKLATCSYRKPKMAWLKEKGALNIIFFIDSLYSGTLDKEKKSCQNKK